jgi:hypothetical protein
MENTEKQPESPQYTTTTALLEAIENVILRLADVEAADLLDRSAEIEARRVAEYERAGVDWLEYEFRAEQAGVAVAPVPDAYKAFVCGLINDDAADDLERLPQPLGSEGVALAVLSVLRAFEEISQLNHSTAKALRAAPRVCDKFLAGFDMGLAAAIVEGA